MKKSTYRDILSAVFLFSGLIYFFKHAIFTRSLTLVWDAADFFYPYLYYISSMYRHGEVPLWNPFLFNGYPMFANVQCQAFYPVNFLFLPFTLFTPYAVHLKLILHYFLAGAFMYLLSRHYLEDRRACLLSAMVYMFSGFMAGHAEHITMVETMTWLPLLFLLTDKAVSKKKLSYAVFAGFFLGICILAGHPQTAIIIFYFLLIHVLYRSAGLYRTDRNPGVFLKSAFTVIVILSLALIIASIQILPAYELVKQTGRSEALSYTLAVGSGQLSLRDAVGFFVPNYFGAITGPYWGNTDISQNLIYIGVVPLALVGVSVLFGRRRVAVIYFFTMAMLSLLISMGDNGVIYRLLFDYLPGVNLFRAPVNYFFVFTFFAALLAGYGFNYLYNIRNRSMFFVCLGLLFTLSAVIYAVSPESPEGIAGVASKNIRDGFIHFGVFYTLFALGTTTCFYYPRLKNLCPVFLLLVTYADLNMTFTNATTIGLPMAPEVYERQIPLITTIKEDSGINHGKGPGIELNDIELRQGLFRVYTEPKRHQGTAIVGYNRAMLYRVFLVEGYDPLVLTRHNRLVDALAKRNPDNFLKINNVRYILRIDLNNGKLRLTYYPDYLPRAFIVGKARFMRDDDRVLEELSSPAFDPSSEVIISEDGRIAGQKAEVVGREIGAGDWDATITRYSANEMEIRATSRYDGFLVISDTYYPGWQAWVDKVEHPVMRANYDFRAVFLPRGQHSVVFKFKPSSLKAGLAISLSGLFLVGFIGLILYIKQ